MDGAGCMAALDAEHYLQEIGSQEGKSDWRSCRRRIHDKITLSPPYLLCHF